MLTILLILLTILPLMAENFEHIIPVAKKVNCILPISIEDNHKLPSHKQKSNTLNVLKDKHNFAIKNRRFSSTAEEHLSMRTEQYDESNLNPVDITKMLKQIEEDYTFPLQNKDNENLSQNEDHKTLSQIINYKDTEDNYESLMENEDITTEETIKLDSSTVHNKILSAAGEIFNSQSQVRKSNQLNMTTKENHMHQLKNKDLLSERTSKLVTKPGDNHKVYEKIEKNRSALIASKANDKLAMQTEKSLDLNMHQEEDHKTLSKIINYKDTEDNYESLMENEDITTEETIKLDSSTVHNKILSAAGEIFNSQSQVRKSNQLNMTTKENHIHQLKNKNLLSERTSKLDTKPGDNHKVYEKIEKNRSALIASKANDKLAMQTEKSLDLNMHQLENKGLQSERTLKLHTKPVDSRKANKKIEKSHSLHKESKVDEKRAIQMEKKLEWNRSIDLSSKWYMMTAKESDMQAHTIELLEESHTNVGSVIEKDNTQITKFKKLVTPPTDIIYIRTTDYREFHMPAGAIGIWPGWTSLATDIPIRPAVTSSISNIFYSDELHLPINILGKLIDEQLEPISDQRIITTLMYSQNRVEPKIVNGNIAQGKDFPYLVSLKRALQNITKTKFLWKNYCGGSIIGPVKVLTAAHCFEVNKYEYLHHPDKLRVVAGSIINRLYHSGDTVDTDHQQWRKIKYVKLHSEFNFPVNDIALVFVDIPFGFEQPMSISFIVPARYNTDYADHCYVAGFGQTRLKKKEDGSVNLLFAEIPVMSRSQCDTVWEMDMKTFVCSHSILSDLGGGDSGGPLACINTLDPSAKNTGGGRLLVGIVSGKNFDKTTLYTRVSAYRDWIDSNSSYVQEPTILVVFFAVIKVISSWFG